MLKTCPLYLAPCSLFTTALWYNGSTSDSGSECQGSNPCRATKTCYYNSYWQVFFFFFSIKLLQNYFYNQPVKEVVGLCQRQLFFWLEFSNQYSGKDH